MRHAQPQSSSLSPDPFPSLEPASIDASPSPSTLSAQSSLLDAEMLESVAVQLPPLVSSSVDTVGMLSPALARDAGLSPMAVTVAAQSNKAFRTIRFGGWAKMVVGCDDKEICNLIG